MLNNMKQYTEDELKDIIDKVMDEDYDGSYQDDDDFCEIVHQHGLNTSVPYKILQGAVLYHLYNMLYTNYPVHYHYRQ
jgi:hypothetical protein